MGSSRTYFRQSRSWCERSNSTVLNKQRAAQRAARCSTKKTVLNIANLVLDTARSDPHPPGPHIPGLARESRAFGA
jgi:hypothetical protein